jgi:hypothetical protein
MFVLDDSTPVPTTPAGYERGLVMARSSPDGYAYAGLANPFPRDLIIPRADWQGIIEEKTNRKTHLSDLAKQAGLPIRSQRSTNYCWAFATVRALELLRVVQNQPQVELSGASVAAPIKRFRNDGGWGKDALEWIIEHGVCPADRWPTTAINRSLDNPANREAAKLYRVTEWWELRPRTIDEHVSCLLRNIPVSVGLNFWGHQVCDTDALWVNGQIGVGFDNSWSEDWGEGGRGVRQGKKILADDAVAPRTGTAA